MPTIAGVSMLLSLVIACGDDGDGPPVDATAPDAALVDAADIDAPAIDAPAIDAPAIDAPAIDAPLDGPPVIGSCADRPADWPAPDTTPPPTPHTHLSLFPSATVDFGSTTNTSQTVYVINDAATSVGPVWIDVGFDGAFALPAVTQGQTLAPGGSITLNISAGAIPGVHHGVIRVHTPGQTLDIGVDQNVVTPPPATPEILTPPTGSRFERGGVLESVVPTNTTVTLTLHNPYPEVGSATGVTATGPWMVISNGCATVAGGGTCPIQVRGLATSTTTVQVATTYGNHSLTLKTEPFLMRTIQVNGPGRVRTRDHQVDCVGPGTCMAPFPGTLCTNTHVVFPDPGRRVTTTWSCTSGVSQTFTADLVADAGVGWTTTTGGVSASAIGDGDQVAILADGEWDDQPSLFTPVPDSVRLFTAGAEVARRNYTDPPTAVAARPGGFVVAGASAGLIWVEALDGTGALVWRRVLDPGRQPALWTGPGGQVYVEHGTGHRHVIALDAGGTVSWRREATGVTFIGADGLGLAFTRALSAGDVELVRWSPNGGISSPQTVTLPPLCAPIWGDAGGKVRLIGDGSRLSHRVDTHAACLSLASTSETGAPLASGTQALPAPMPLIPFAVVTQCGGIAVVTIDEVRFVAPALTVSATRALGPLGPTDADKPSTSAVGPTGSALVTRDHRVMVFRP